MFSLKTTCAGKIFALAKPNDSVGKRTRNRIPKEERKALVESFIKKHQKLNNGSFPSLSLTHKEVGGSFYTIREIVREIIQENRVLGPGNLTLEGNGSDQLQDRNLSSSILMDPVPPLSLSPNGFHSVSDQSHKFSSEDGEMNLTENGGNINSSVAAPEDTGSDILECGEVNGNLLLDEDVGLIHQSIDSTDVSMVQLAASSSDENDIKCDAGLQNSMEMVCDSVATKPQDIKLKVDDRDSGSEEITFWESDSTISINTDERVNDAGAAISESGIENISNISGTVGGMPAETAFEPFPLKSAQPCELNKVSEGGKGTETEMEADSSTINHIDLGEISSSTSSAVVKEKGTEVNMEKKVEDKIVNLASVDVECANTIGTVVVNDVIDNIHETKESSNGTLATEQKMATSGTESESRNNDRPKVESSHAGNEVTSGEKKTTMEKRKLDAPDSSSSQKENNATLNRIKPESWKGESNMGRQETNPLLEVLKSLVTAFVKFWSE